MPLNHIPAFQAIKTLNISMNTGLRANCALSPCSLSIEIMLFFREKVNVDKSADQMCIKCRKVQYDTLTAKETKLTKAKADVQKEARFGPLSLKLDAPGPPRHSSHGEEVFC